MSLFGWMSSRSRAVALGLERGSAAPAAARAALEVSPEYAGLHRYLDDRYASLAVLTFEQIESLLGFPLPAAARTEETWWTRPGPHTAAWEKARRTAAPNLLARNVAFQRRP
jgi:hypothetical protein